VLIVEDDPSITEMLQITLRSRLLGVRVALTGMEALAALTEHPPDVVLLDLGLPDVDGVDVCRQMRASSNVPIVVLTADGAEERLIAALDAGADDYVTKPFSMPELLARVRVALRRGRPRRRDDHGAAGGAAGEDSNR